jgi:hypothetical protein
MKICDEIGCKLYGKFMAFGTPYPIMIKCLACKYHYKVDMREENDNT